MVTRLSSPIGSEPDLGFSGALRADGCWRRTRAIHGSAWLCHLLRKTLTLLIELREGWTPGAGRRNFWGSATAAIY
jgi:hypothetical protein